MANNVDHNLFTYPRRSGHKDFDTSLEAADKIEKSGRAEALRKLVLKCISDTWDLGLTADQCAELLNESVLSVRPRVAELHKRNLIKDTGRRRKNVSGAKAKVWVIT